MYHKFTWNVTKKFSVTKKIFEQKNSLWDFFDNFRFFSKIEKKLKNRDFFNLVKNSFVRKNYFRFISGEFLIYTVHSIYDSSYNYGTPFMMLSRCTSLCASRFGPHMPTDLRCQELPIWKGRRKTRLRRHPNVGSLRLLPCPHLQGLHVTYWQSLYAEQTQAYPIHTFELHGVFHECGFGEW